MTNSKVYVAVAGWEAIALSPVVVALYYHDIKDIDNLLIQQLVVQQLQQRHYRQLDLERVEREVTAGATYTTATCCAGDINSFGINRVIELKIERVVLELVLKLGLRLPTVTVAVSSRLPLPSSLNWVKENSIETRLTSAFATSLRRQHVNLAASNCLEYDWSSNQGFATLGHWQAILDRGPRLDYHYVAGLYHLPQWLWRLAKRNRSDAKYYFRLCQKPPAWWKDLFPQKPIDLLTSKQIAAMRQLRRTPLVPPDSTNLSNKYFYADLPEDVPAEFLEWVRQSEDVIPHKLGYKNVRS